MTWIEEILGAGLLLSVTAVFIVLLEIWTRRTRPPAEVSRKIIHIGGLFPCLLLPVLVHSLWSVFGICLLTAAALHFNERRGFLISFSRVQRETYGTAYYPLAVFIVFVLSGGRTWMYISAILALCLADALAAIIGISYARIRYSIENQWKSLEGSLVFLLVTYLAVLLPLLMLTSIPWEACLLAALLTALLVTGFEAISLQGFDNLIVPVGVCIVLDRVVKLEWMDLLIHNLVLVLLLAGLSLLARFVRQLEFGVFLVFVLFSYTAIVYADWRWSLAPLVGFACFVIVRVLYPPPVPGQRSRIKVLLAVRVLLPLLLILAFANATGRHGFLQGPYICCAALTLCFSMRVFLSLRNVGPARVHPALPFLGGGIIGFALTLPPWGLQGAPIKALAGIALICALFSAVHEWTLPLDRPKTVQQMWTTPRIILIYTALLCLMMIQAMGIVPLWPELSNQEIVTR